MSSLVVHLLQCCSARICGYRRARRLDRGYCGDDHGRFAPLSPARPFTSERMRAQTAPPSSRSRTTTRPCGPTTSRSRSAWKTSRAAPCPSTTAKPCSLPLRHHLPLHANAMDGQRNRHQGLAHDATVCAKNEYACTWRCR